MNRTTNVFLKVIFLFLVAILLNTENVFSQAYTPVQPAYPKTVGYFSFILPVVSMNKNTTTNDFANFNNGFAIGFPIGLNVLYSDKFGVSYEFTPTIKSGNGSTKTSNLLFDPGAMFRFKHGFTFISRLAFETSGRYGVTPVFNKIIKRTKDVNYFMAVSLPTRFGNNELPTIGGSIQFGLILN